MFKSSTSKSQMCPYQSQKRIQENPWLDQVWFDPIDLYLQYIYLTKSNPTQEKLLNWQSWIVHLNKYTKLKKLTWNIHSSTYNKRHTVSLKKTTNKTHDLPWLGYFLNKNLQIWSPLPSPQIWSRILATDLYDRAERYVKAWFFMCAPILYINTSI